jgi:hypothetical protein
MSCAVDDLTRLLGIDPFTIRRDQLRGACNRPRVADLPFTSDRIFSKLAPRTQ